MSVKFNREYEFYTADVFTDQAFGGNQLAVFPQASGLTTQQMQNIAAEFNISETAFVFPSTNDDCTNSLRIFTPDAELPFAGHPTIGAAHILSLIGDVNLDNKITKIVFEEGSGPVPVLIHQLDGYPAFVELTAPQLPIYGSEHPSVQSIANVLSLDIADILHEKLKPQSVSCGLPFLFIPISNRAAIKKARLNREVWEREFMDYWAPDFYLYTFDPESAGVDIRARMFGPSKGIGEDSATGSAAVGLAGYLGSLESNTDGTIKWKIEQGFEIGRQSFLNIEVDKKDGEISAIRVGGSSVLVTKGVMYIT
ncbi:PhzF family phenazine biosynthesis protein [SAR202 cluster bacterium AC-409-J13_OGT_754m]|nr:PhzF family phenazine biosynthesis protein [SAR202 cluster bacterium AC-409-J13_OGT_754m]